MAYTNQALHWFPLQALLLWGDCSENTKSELKTNQRILFRQFYLDRDCFHQRPRSSLNKQTNKETNKQTKKPSISELFVTKVFKEENHMVDGDGIHASTVWQGHSMGFAVAGLHHLETKTIGNVEGFVYDTYDMDNRTYFNQ